MTTAGLQAKVALRGAWFDANPNKPLPEAREEVERLFAAIEDDALRGASRGEAPPEPDIDVDRLSRAIESIGKAKGHNYVFPRDAADVADEYAEMAVPECIADGSHSDDLSHADELRHRTGRHAGAPPSPQTPSPHPAFGPDDVTPCHCGQFGHAAPLSPDTAQLARIRARHTAVSSAPYLGKPRHGVQCSIDQQRWPCDAATLLELVESGAAR